MRKSRKNPGEGVSRRSFVTTLGASATAAAVLSWDGPRALARSWSLVLPEADRPLLLHNNENPLGPSPKALAAMNASLGSGRPVANYSFNRADLKKAISKAEGVPAGNIMIGNGSTQLLRTVTHVYSSAARPLVSGAPSYEECTDYANLVGTPVTAVPLDSEMRLDLKTMADASKDAGIVFVNNPNNPTGTLASPAAIANCIERVLSLSNHCVVLIDEAYHDYVTAPSYKSELRRAVDNKRIIVARTFSKAHGMAGMRVGYVVAHTETLEALGKWHYGTSLNVPSLAGATASMVDQGRLREEQARNTEARSYTLDWFRSHGKKVTDSQTNFVFVETGMPAVDFRDGCAAHNIKVGRNFPPYENSWARISISTLDDMRRATDVFGQVMGIAATSEAA